MQRHLAFQLMKTMRKRVGEKWPKFLATLTSKAEADDRDQIFLDDFVAICLKFKLKLSDKQTETLTDSYPGRKEGDRLRINVGRFYDLDLGIL